MDRQDLISQIAKEILNLGPSQPAKIGIDGVDGAGKTVLADELATSLKNQDRPILRSSIDYFHNPRSLRYARGRQDPLGYYLDSFNLTALVRDLMEPLEKEGSGRIRTQVFNLANDQPQPAPWITVSNDTLLVFDGIFLARPELLKFWDYLIYLHVDYEISIPRLAARDGGSPDTASPLNQRYIGGQEIYRRRCQPETHAHLVVNNNNLMDPFIITRDGKPI